MSDSSESLQPGGGEHVERSELPPGGGAVRGREGRSERRALHGPEARYGRGNERYITDQIYHSG